MTYTVVSSFVCTCPLTDMTIVGLHDFVKVSFSASLKSFFFIICIDAPESTTNSRSSSLRFDARWHLFFRDEKNAALSCSFNLNTFLASFHAASRASYSCPCHSVSSWDRSWNFGALELRWWGYSGQIYLSEGFWSRILVWRAIAFANFTRWIGVCAHPENRLRRLHVLKYATQWPCIRWSTLRWSSSQLLITLLIRLPWSTVTLVGDKSSFMTITFPQYSHCTFVIILFGPFSRLFINLTMCEWALFPKRQPLLVLWNKHSGGCHFFTKWVAASSPKGTPCKVIGTFSRWDSFSWYFGFSMLFSHSAAWKNSETGSAVSFLHVYWHGNCNCLLQETARWTPIPNNLQEFFIHAILFPDSWPGRFFHNFRVTSKCIIRRFCSILLVTIVFNVW